MVILPRGFLLRWVVAYVVAAGLGGAISGFAGRIPLWAHWDYATTQFAWRALAVATGLLAVTLLDVVQWRLLRGVLPALSWRAWVGAAVVAALLVRVVNEVVQASLGAPRPTSVSAILLLLLHVLAIGVAQYWVLRRHVDDALAWPLAYAAGTLTGSVVVQAVAGRLIDALIVDPSKGPPLPAFTAIVFLIPAIAAIAPALTTGWAIPRLAPRLPSANMERHDERTEPAL